MVSIFSLKENLIKSAYGWDKSINGYCLVKNNHSVKISVKL